MYENGFILYLIIKHNYEFLYLDYSFYLGAGVAHYSAWLRTGRPGDRGSIPGRGKRIFPLAYVTRPALGPTQPPVQ
jgi:hypothetical protein